MYRFLVFLQHSQQNNIFSVHLRTTRFTARVHPHASIPVTNWSEHYWKTLLEISTQPLYIGVWHWVLKSQVINPACKTHWFLFFLYRIFTKLKQNQAQSAHAESAHKGVSHTKQSETDTHWHTIPSHSKARLHARTHAPTHTTRRLYVCTLGWMYNLTHTCSQVSVHASTFCFTSTEARWLIRDGDGGGGGGGRTKEWRLDRGYRPKKTGETAFRRQTNGTVKAVSPRH